MCDGARVNRTAGSKSRSRQWTFEVISFECAASDHAGVGLINHLHSRWLESSKPLDPWWRCNTLYEAGASALRSATQTVYSLQISSDPNPRVTKPMFANQFVITDRP